MQRPGAAYSPAPASAHGPQASRGCQAGCRACRVGSHSWARPEHALGRATVQAAQPPKRIAVVGAGMLGLSTAWFLQEHGAEVTVFERAAVASGASWGNAGRITPGLAAPLAVGHDLARPAEQARHRLVRGARGRRGASADRAGQAPAGRLPRDRAAPGAAGGA